MEAYQQSVLDERDDFIPHFGKVAQFVDSPDFFKTVSDPTDQELARQQLRVMSEYLAILNARAARYTIAAADPIPIVTVGPGTDAHTGQSVGTVGPGTPMTEEGAITNSADAVEVHPIPGAAVIPDASVAGSVAANDDADAAASADDAADTSTDTDAK